MREIARYTFQYKRFLFTLFVFVFIQSLSQLFLPTLMGNIVDFGVVTGDIPYIWKTGLWMILVAAIGVVMSIVISHIAAKVAMSVGRDIRAEVFTHVSNFSLREFNTIGTGSLTIRTTNDITQIQQALVMVLRMFLMAPFMLIGGILMAVSKDVRLSLVILLAIPFIALTIFILLKVGYPLFQQVQKRLDRLNVVLRENLTGIRVIRAFAKEREESDRFNAANVDLTKTSVKVNRLMAFTMPAMMLLMNVTIVCIIWFGGIRIEAGSMQIGDLMAFIQYVMLILMALMMASMMFVILPRATVSAKRIAEVLQMERTTSEYGTGTFSEKINKITFKHVSFRYPGAKEFALRNVTFQANAGKTTAIIGGTGAGKTTLIQLVVRLIEQTEGKIYCNEESIQFFDVNDLRGRIGYIPQTARLFSGTVTENLRFGYQKASLEEIKRVARIAQADDFITSLENEYDTYIEQGGKNLSGGQQQRLSIARALLRKPDIYLFDDSFSALDYETDKKLRTALRDEVHDKIVIIVAQRVSTIMNADQIIVLDQGEVAGIGTHKELIRSNDVYREIVASQLGKEAIA